MLVNGGNFHDYGIWAGIDKPDMGISDVLGPTIIGMTGTGRRKQMKPYKMQLSVTRS